MHQKKQKEMLSMNFRETEMKKSKSVFEKLFGTFSFEKNKTERKEQQPYSLICRKCGKFNGLAKQNCAFVCSFCNEEQTANKPNLKTVTDDLCSLSDEDAQKRKKEN